MLGFGFLVAVVGFFNKCRNLFSKPTSLSLCDTQITSPKHSHTTTKTKHLLSLTAAVLLVQSPTCSRCGSRKNSTFL